MFKRLFISLAAFAIVPLLHAQTVFVNEFHYDDNNSTDTLEGIEIAGPAGTDLDCYQIVLYNGAGGGVISTINLSGTIPDQCNGFGAVWFSISPLQNGSPDGFALVFNPGLAGCGTAGVLTVIQFLSYEGTFVAVGGPANGMTSVSVGVQETNSTPMGSSLQLSGSGTIYSDFIWQVPAPNTMGTLNNGQTFGAGPCAPIVPTQLVITNLPSGCLTPGTPFTLNVCATNSSGVIDPNYNSLITLALASGTPPLSGTLTLNAVNGCASFTGLSLNAIDTFSFSATSGLLSGITNVIYTSDSCTICPNLESAFIDACGPTEGNNEILIFNSGNFFIPVNSSAMSISYGAGTPPATSYTSSFTSNQAYVDSLNARAGCIPPLFMDALSNSPIPPNTSFMVMRYDPTNIYDFQNWCAQGPIYIAFSNDPDWNSTGNFRNCGGCDSLDSTGTFPRYFRTNFSALTNGGACDFTYQYIPCTDLMCMGDGDGLSWGYGGGNPTYSWNECTPNSLLDVNYRLPLSGYRIDDEHVNLVWQTSIETDFSHFILERSDAWNESFREIARLNGLGSGSTYLHTDADARAVSLQYRLIAVDLDGGMHPSNVVHVANTDPSSDWSVYYDQTAAELVFVNGEHAERVLVSDIQGRILYQSSTLPNSMRVPVSLSAGIYFVTISDGKVAKHVKFLIGH